MTFFTSNSLLSTLLALAFSLCSPSAYAQVLQQQYAKGKLAMTILGFDESHNPSRSSLANRDARFHSLDLKAGHTYMIQAYCDQDCRDIDLTLYDNNGNQIDLDVQQDDLPLVTVTPRYSARFRYKVTMADCRITPCTYMVAVYGN